MPLAMPTLGLCWFFTRAWDGSQCPWPRLHWDYTGPLQGHGMGLNVPGHAYTGIMLVLYKGMGWVSMPLAMPTLGLSWSFTRAWDGSQCPWPRLYWDYAGPLHWQWIGLKAPGHAYTGIMLVLYKGMEWVSMPLASPTLGAGPLQGQWMGLNAPGGAT